MFTPKIGEDDPLLTSIFFRWVGSTTNQYITLKGTSPCPTFGKENHRLKIALVGDMSWNHQLAGLEPSKSPNWSWFPSLTPGLEPSILPYITDPPTFFQGTETTDFQRRHICQDVSMEWTNYEFDRAAFELTRVEVPKMKSWEFKVSPPMPTPPRNKHLIRPYWGKPMVNSPLIRPYFLGG